MAKAKHTYAVRLGVEGGNRVKADLRSVGASGERCSRRSTAPPTRPHAGSARSVTVPPLSAATCGCWAVRLPPPPSAAACSKW